MHTRQDPVPIIFSSSPFQLFTLIMLFLSLLYQHWGLVLLSLLLIALFIGSRLWSGYNLKNLDYTLVIQRNRLFPGENSTAECKVVNNKLLPLWLELGIVIDRFLLDRPQKDQEHNPGPGKPEEGGAATNGLDAGENLLSDRTSFSKKEQLTMQGGLLFNQEINFSFTLSPNQRGVYRVGPVRITGADIFGFSHREHELNLYHTIIIYPRLINLNPLSLPLRELFGSPGSKSPVVDPVYPVTTRDYQENRPARHIHWKTSARLGRLQEKVFEPSVQQKLLIVLDVSGFTEENTAGFEQMLEVAASLAFHAERKGQAFGLVSNGALEELISPNSDLENKSRATDQLSQAVLSPGAGPGQLLLFLEFLARLQLKEASSGLESLIRAAGITRGTTALYMTNEANHVDPATLLYFQNLKTPVIPVTTKPVTEHGGIIYNINDLLAEEEVLVG